MMFHSAYILNKCYSFELSIHWTILKKSQFAKKYEAY